MALRRRGYDGTLVSLKQVEGVVCTEDELWCGYLCMNICVIVDGVYRN